MAEEAEDDTDDNATSNSKPQVFDMLQQSTSQQNPFMFEWEKMRLPSVLCFVN